MGRRRKSAPLTPGPTEYARDESMTGSVVRIKGERGLYRVHYKETNVLTGVSWLVLFGGACKNWRHKYIKDTTLVKRSRNG